MLMAAAPLHRRFKIMRIVAATYQAASGAGFQAMKELEEETRAQLEKRPFARSVMPHPYAFNLFPHDSPIDDNGYAEEELKMLHETRKILNDDQIWIHATCVRVPVLRAHSEALNITFSQPVSVEEAYEVLGKAPGLTILEDRKQNRFTPCLPMQAARTMSFAAASVRIYAFPNTLDLMGRRGPAIEGSCIERCPNRRINFNQTGLCNNFSLSSFYYALYLFVRRREKGYKLFSGNANPRLSRIDRQMFRNAAKSGFHLPI